MRSLTTAATLCALAVAPQYTVGQGYNGPEDPRISAALTLKLPTNGVSVTPNGRIFLVNQPVAAGTTGPQIVEYHGATNTTTPYPNAEWNNFTMGANPATHFVGANSHRIGPDGNLWVVDMGAAKQSTITSPEAVKVVSINITTNTVSRVYGFGNATDYKSHLDDIRFHTSTGKAYLTDAGSPGLIVLDLASGDTRRVLNNDFSTGSTLPVSAEGHFLYTNGEPAFTYADQLEVTPDGKWLDYQPSSGFMNRIQTQYLDDAFYNSSMNDNAILDQHVQPFAPTPSTGGTAIDADGNIYYSDVDSARILKILPNGTVTTLVQDPRLTWIDAMWIDSNQTLWMPNPQLYAGTQYNNGTSRMQPPFHVYTINIGVGSSPIDHA